MDANRRAIREWKAARGSQGAGSQADQAGPSNRTNGAGAPSETSSPPLSSASGKKKKKDKKLKKKKAISDGAAANSEGKSFFFNFWEEG